MSNVKTTVNTVSEDITTVENELLSLKIGVDIFFHLQSQKGDAEQHGDALEQDQLAPLARRTPAASPAARAKPTRIQRQTLGPAKSAEGYSDLEMLTNSRSPWR